YQPEAARPRGGHPPRALGADRSDGPEAGQAELVSAQEPRERDGAAGSAPVVGVGWFVNVRACDEAAFAAPGPVGNMSRPSARRSDDATAIATNPRESGSNVDGAASIGDEARSRLGVRGGERSLGRIPGVDPEDDAQGSPRLTFYVGPG